MTSETVLQKAMMLIGKASAEARIAEVSRITRIAERINEIQCSQAKLEAEIQSLAVELDRSTSATANAIGTETTSVLALGAQRSSSQPPLLGPLAVEIDWSSVGRSLPKQTICERKASDTLRVLLENILKHFGDDMMAKLALLRVNRAPPLSRRPEVDFLNRKRGTSYQHQRIGNSSWHVLTHSSTPEKIEFVRQLAQALRFPAGAMTAREIDVQQELERLLTLT